MTVYVDTMRAKVGRMTMCHCWADHEHELFEMMVKVGVDLKWYQMPPGASWKHFDISLAKRALVLKFGGVETDKYGPVEYEARQRFIEHMRTGREGRARFELKTMCRVGMRRMKNAEV